MASIVIEVPSNGKTYTLQFTRRVIIKMQAEKFDRKTEDADVIYDFVRYALMKNHPEATDDDVEAIVDSIPLESKDGKDMEGFIKDLSELLTSSIDTFKTSKQGNAHWEVR